jgi:hypothetical protein
MTEPGDEFETFLKTRTVLPNAMSDDDKLEPPKALDAIVLKEAREAIRARQRLNRTPRWAMPVALAATILLCLSIVLNVSLNTDRPTANLRRTTAATADKASPTPASPASEGERREKVADGASPNEVILPEAKVAELRAPRPPVVAETAASAESPRPDGAAADNAGALAKRSDTPAQALREAAAGANSAADKAPQLADRSRTPTRGPSEATSAADIPAQLAGHSRAPAQVRNEARSAADTPAQLAHRARTSAQAQSEATAAAIPPHPQDPETWLQQIAALRAEGKTAQADAEMHRFRATFPGYPAKLAAPAPSEPSK